MVWVETLVHSCKTALFANLPASTFASLLMNTNFQLRLCRSFQAHLLITFKSRVRDPWSHKRCLKVSQLSVSKIQSSQTSLSAHSKACYSAFPSPSKQEVIPLTEPAKHQWPFLHNSWLRNWILLCCHKPRTIAINFNSTTARVLQLRAASSSITRNLNVGLKNCTYFLLSV